MLRRAKVVLGAEAGRRGLIGYGLYGGGGVLAGYVGRAFFGL